MKNEFLIKKRICIVDDQLIVLDALKLILEEIEHVEIVGVFNSAEAFLNGYEDLQPDVTVIDLNLPVLSGIDAITTIKFNYPQAKFLVLTNHDDDEKLFNALKAGADGYLLKKNSFENVAFAIDSILFGGAPMTPEIARKVIKYFQRHKQMQSRRFEELTEKESLVLSLLAEGLLYKEIADKLSLGIDSLKKTIQRIYEKLQVHNRSEAIKKYLTQ